MKRKPAIPAVRASTSTKPPYCKCGARGSIICGTCAAAYRAWVEKNTAMRGGNE